LVELLKQGGLAAVAVIAIYVALKKDKQVTSLYDRLEAKSEKYLEQHLRLEKELKETISALGNALKMEEP